MCRRFLYRGFSKLHKAGSPGAGLCSTEPPPHCFPYTAPLLLDQPQSGPHEDGLPAACPHCHPQPPPCMPLPLKRQSQALLPATRQLQHCSWTALLCHGGLHAAEDLVALHGAGRGLAAGALGLGAGRKSCWDVAPQGGYGPQNLPGREVTGNRKGGITAARRIHPIPAGHHSVRISWTHGASTAGQQGC